jgi:hypothetical protein
MNSPIAISARTAARFRARKSGIASPLPSIADAARALSGAQSQIEAPSRWGLAMRTAGVPSSDDVRNALLQQRSIVRVWGQRDTVHAYATEDWPMFATAQTLWPRSARTGTMPTESELADFVGVIDALQRPFTRSDLLDSVPGRLVDEFTRTPVNNDPPARMAATRLIWRAGGLGYLSSTSMVGREQAYAARSWWTPGLVWNPGSPEQECINVVRRYLQTWAPARVHDIAHFLGANVSDVRRWVAALRDETVTTTLEGLPDHLVLRSDVAELQELADVGHDDEPVRLIPAYDTQMMSHGNKDLVLADPALRPLVWAKAATVNATLFVDGRFVGTWKHDIKRKQLHIELRPFGRLNDLEARVYADAKSLAAHLGVEPGPVQVVISG